MDNLLKNSNSLQPALWTDIKIAGLLIWMYFKIKTVKQQEMNDNGNIAESSVVMKIYASKDNHRDIYYYFFWDLEELLENIYFEFKLLNRLISCG